jgi:hypothetical protein
MSKLRFQSGTPTMIIPQGTEVRTDAQGQLSIRTPGNLVLQSSGRYGVIESLGGSIRIEHGAKIEAVQLKCPGACYIQGELTAWRVTASEIHLDSEARASIVLQEADQVEVGRASRLVGNFGSEKELFLLFSRFAREVKSLPLFGESSQEPKTRELAHGAETANENLDAEVEDAEVVEAESALPEQLIYARVLLEKAAEGNQLHGLTRRKVHELVQLLREADLTTLRHTYRTLVQLREVPGAEIRRAFELIESHFEAQENASRDADG